MESLACPAGVEPATYGLEGRCSIQLSYGQILAGSISRTNREMVGVQGFEPWTPCSQSRCATRLRYTPTEPIFYTDRAFSGKSCKILGMVAYFSSKLIKQIHAVLASVLLIACLLGTHWIGYAHSVSHASKAYPAESKLNAPETDVAFSHSADVCHLFDALSLAGFVPEVSNQDLTTPVVFDYIVSNLRFHFAQTSALAYHSRAPPSPLL